MQILKPSNFKALQLFSFPKMSNGASTRFAE